MNVSALIVAWVLFAVALVVMLHELGHVLGAKLFGVRVDVCSFGFGPTLLQRRFGDTYWRISAIPLGGFTKMAGEHASEVTGDPQEYLSKPKWKRLVIGAAGCASNVLIAILLLTVMYAIGFEVPASQTQSAIIGWVDADSPAAKAGIEIGDRITRVGAEETPHWEDVAEVIAINLDRPLEIIVIRDGREKRCSVTPHGASGTLSSAVGWHPVMPPKIEAVEHNSPAEEAGLQPGDEIISINNVPSHYWPQITQHFSNEEVQVVYVRHEQSLIAQLHPVPQSVGTTALNDWTIGATFKEEMVKYRLGVLSATWKSITTIRKFTLVTVVAIRQMLAGKRSTGYIKFVALTSPEAPSLGFSNLMLIISMLSFFLAVFNLLPIPLLDGGTIGILLVEMVLRRDISERAKENFMKIGFVIVVIFMIFIISNDIFRLLKK